MRDISKEELDLILDKHDMWLKDEDGGEKANLSSANLSSANLSSANLRYANLSSANLSSANLRYADLRYADLRSADLRSAYLSYADLRSADLRSAYLRSADLRSAYLSYADLSSATGQYYITQRSDGYQFFLVLDESGSWMIRAGCRYKSIQSYRDHLRTYDCEDKKIETTLILDFAEAKLNAIPKQEEQAA